MLNARMMQRQATCAAIRAASAPVDTIVPKTPDEAAAKAALIAIQIFVFSMAIFDLLMAWAVTNQTCPP